MKSDRCPHCHAKMKEYIHTLNRQMVESLKVLAEQGGAGNISHIGLSHNQICNFAKLKYWNLIDKAGADMWRITAYGYDFLAGFLKIQKSVVTFRGNVVRREGEMVDIKFYFSHAYLHRFDYAIQAKSVIEDENGKLF